MHLFLQRYKLAFILSYYELKYSFTIIVAIINFLGSET